MSVSTQQINWGLYEGHTKVEIRTGCTDSISMIFKTRHEAAQFLQAMRKRVR